MKFDNLIIGGGLAGLVCGIRCAQAGLKTGIISKGESGLAFASGTIDVLGHGMNGQVLHNPLAGIESMIASKPKHPYGKLGLATIVSALEWFQRLSDDMEMPYRPLSEKSNHLRFTALGVLRPTYLAPESMTKYPVMNAAGDVKRIAVVNIEGFRDFQPDLMAANLRRHPEFTHAAITSHTIKLSARLLNHRDPNTMRSVELSRQLDNDLAISMLAKAIKAAAGEVDLLFIPSVLSMDHGIERAQQLSAMSGMRVCELATLPPSLPGIRLSNRLYQRFNRLGGLMMAGDQVQDGDIADGRIHSLKTHSNRQISLTADHVVLATGSFMSSGLVANRHEIREAAFGLDVNTHLPRSQWANAQFLNGKAHAFSGFGVETDHLLRGYKNGQLIENLYCVGSVLGNAQPVEEGSSGGIAIATGWAVAEDIIQKSQSEESIKGVGDNVC
ncbi:anaerobic glycerol-3-phosphate dehydrogenase subunit B [Endozoicomonas sp. (ex Bugula neritina AB1)]|nr:anaerobic glycerol-3-phosphate dehydrogenase subunit B [Endozoicomonas sp. (ex Bugula neritina AB1)]